VGAAALSLLGVAGLSAAAVKAPAKGAVKPGAPKPAARKLTAIPLADPSGKTRTLAEFGDRKALVLVFIGTECPISNSYAEPLSQLAARYEGKGVQFVGVNANPGEDLAAVKRHAAEYRLSFPVLKDSRQELADRIGARVTPEAFVLDAARAVRYQGRIDDTYASRTVRRADTQSRDLQEAIDAVLAGKPLAQKITRAFGCAIYRPEKGAATAAVTFHRDVEPIFQERCQSCHRPGQIGPFALMTYADAKNWAAEIKAFTSSRQMPPWKAEPGHGEFMDVRRLPDAQVETISRWVESGA